MQNLDFLQSLGPKLSGREAARAEETYSFPFPSFLVPAGGSSSAARVCPSSSTSRLQVRTNQSNYVARSQRTHRCTVISSKSVSAMIDGLGWFTERREVRGGTKGSRWLNYREANAFPDIIPRAWSRNDTPKETLNYLTCDSILLVHRLHPAVGNQARGQSPNGIFWCSLTTSERDIHFAFVPFTLTP